MSGCKQKQAEQESDQAPAIGESEVARARQACAAYKKAVCEASKASPDLAQTCKLAGAREEAIDLQARTLNAKGDMTASDRAVVEGALRRIAKGCIDDTASFAARRQR